ncbi:hypothetical protein PUR71_37870 [Streptomyces sp. SP17BM10]|uniref:hypothetical protein n=1 Tax=Streptomyces sp. SP17BM10 TaxID=3002530 RepID=UPI002E776B82|nr:hypothetical protein [Streptomyces sp. SP17BM10]MEE1788630.1 hypothetical protein [Streptomyces sp. SP17BM10]
MPRPAKRPSPARRFTTRDRALAIREADADPGIAALVDVQEPASPRLLRLHLPGDGAPSGFVVRGDVRVREVPVDE